MTYIYVANVCIWLTRRLFGYPIIWMGNCLLVGWQGIIFFWKRSLHELWYDIYKYANVLQTLAYLFFYLIYKQYTQNSPQKNSLFLCFLFPLPAFYWCVYTVYCQHTPLYLFIYSFSVDQRAEKLVLSSLQRLWKGNQESSFGLLLCWSVALQQCFQKLTTMAGLFCTSHATNSQAPFEGSIRCLGHLKSDWNVKPAS